ncbi:hypothetical protein COCSUDRAFT_32494 [Coccomyxa subellipsoidea C-169]|uniref:Uncharacterized protein n=1 Tax=Coccomyxa subellipsoidea (strain C-169) TaxID=574566 RepID=I0Z659_COCSC|nr:hypothetical protein COCSUDRAFT_32494 [Coccomyxa subellipsoidea C-169]EIE26128.1 hypothetical protein COCSUDRAFT_32494 [Coccomyxa subellipsoidea C-169]|eukprot:XP_005650672.1 hypothetical protein COCSUDRAFT_32494 [Coccomyxa subellipsoidea C-169]
MQNNNKVAKDAKASILKPQFRHTSMPLQEAHWQMKPEQKPHGPGSMYGPIHVSENSDKP